MLQLKNLHKYKTSGSCRILKEMPVDSDYQSADKTTESAQPHDEEAPPPYNEDRAGKEQSASEQALANKEPDEKRRRTAPVRLSEEYIPTGIIVDKKAHSKKKKSLHDSEEADNNPRRRKTFVLLCFACLFIGIMSLCC